MFTKFRPHLLITLEFQSLSFYLESPIMRFFAVAVPVFAGLSNARVVDRRQLAPAEPVSASITPTASATPLTKSTISTDPAKLDSNTDDYYLGYREADFKKPYAKYYNPVVAPISDSLVNGLTGSPWPSAFTYSAWEAHDYFTRPGYLELENGYSISENGTLMIAVRSEIPQVTGEHYDWWFGWHSVETARYKLWNPIAHQYSYRTPQSEDWANQTLAERYIGTTSYIDEFVGQDAAKLSIEFVQPESLGFNTTAWPEQGIETIVIGKVMIGSKFGSP